MSRKVRGWLLVSFSVMTVLGGQVMAQRGTGETVGLARQGANPTIVSIEGKFKVLVSGECELTTGRSALGSHMLVTTEDGKELNVHLGPTSEVGFLTEKLSEGNAITAKVFRTDRLKEDHWVAQSVSVDGKAYELRTAALRPVWAGANNSAGRAGQGRAGGMGQGRGSARGNGRGPACGNGPGPGRRGGQGCRVDSDRPCVALAASVESASSSSEDAAGITKEEVAGILTMRQDEKLAHDVYVTLGEKWGLPTFTNISGAETRHMSAMKMLIERYGLKDPIADVTVGKFDDPEFASLYAKLVKEGSESVVAAHKVGALIEELDIADLREAQAKSEQPAVKMVYENLERASRNHLRAFASQLKVADEGYVAKHLSQEQFDKIATSDWERGGPWRNKGVAQGQGQGRGRGPGAGRGNQGGRGRGNGMGGGQGRGPGRGNGWGRGQGQGRGNGRGRGGL